MEGWDFDMTYEVSEYNPYDFIVVYVNNIKLTTNKIRLLPKEMHLYYNYDLFATIRYDEIHHISKYLMVSDSNVCDHEGCESKDKIYGIWEIPRLGSIKLIKTTTDKQVATDLLLTNANKPSMSKYYLKSYDNETEVCDED